jgi:hypothetical protein
MTNARLGAEGTDWERRLTSRLRPVREVLEVTEMDFDELLQRDLDDHRVATELVPYLLRGADAGPAFFPPVLAVLLPFHGRDATTFPDAALTPLVEEQGLPFVEEVYGDAFRVRRLLEEGSGDLNEIRYGNLAWNDERAKIVVIDGQHRAMSLLAIDRTMSRSWEDDARGARYRHFYQGRVERALAEYGSESIGMVQVPVTVCWFPELVGEAHTPHVAARKLFVDVNREAKPPSTDRVVLLSDDDLLNILTRSVLNALRVRQSDPPLYAVEYDSPATSGRPARWSAILSLQSVKNMVNRAVFGPKKFVTNVGIPMRGRESESERDAFMRDQLRVRELFRHEVGDVNAVRREELGRDSFPRDAVDPLRYEFEAGWGAGLLELLGGLLPYRAHYSALRELDEAWQPADPSTVDALAREAVFEGVGMYWTLRDSFEYWRSTTPVTDRTAKPDIVQAWERVRTKGEEFRRRRSVQYLGDDRDDAVALSDSFYDVVGTQACQVSLALLLGTVAAQAGIAGPAVPGLAHTLTKCLNAGLASTADDGVDRRLFVAQQVEAPLNRIGDMNTPRAVEFRYFWLELLCVDDVLTTLVEEVDSLDRDAILVLRDSARARYTQQLIDERVAERRRYDRSRSKADLLTPVTLEVMASIEAALAHWFSIYPNEFRSWAQSADFTIGVDEESS